MPVENASTIAELNPLWPLGTDPKEEGDDHLRLLKDVMQSDAVSQAELDALQARLVSTSKIINGNFDVWQRGTVFQNLTAPVVQYGPDRWRYLGSNTLVDATITQTVGPDAQSPVSMSVTAIVADAAPGVNAVATVEQRIEGYDAQVFKLGEAAAGQMTLGFWVMSSVTGTFCVSFGNADRSRTYVAEYTINQANIWEEKSISIACDLQGTWGKGNGIGLEVAWCVQAGTNLQGTGDTWSGSNFYATVNQVNGFATPNDIFRLARVQLTRGLVADEFAFQKFADVLARCERYYQKSYSVESAPGTITDFGRYRMTQNGFPSGVFTTGVPVRLHGQMRASPTAVVYSPTTGGANLVDMQGNEQVTPNAVEQGRTHLYVQATQGAATTATQVSLQFAADAEL
jgi:hypothetical protein